MKLTVTLLLVTAALSGCATSSRTHTAGGEEGYNIACSGSILDWRMCSEKAEQLCGAKGYVVLERNGDQGTMLAGNQYGLFAGSVTDKSMVVKCKE